MKHHLIFTDGKVDCNAMCNRIEDKRNLFTQLNHVKLALLPYRDTLFQHNNIQYLNNIQEKVAMPKSKLIYQQLIKVSLLKRFQLTLKWKTIVG